MVADLEDGKGGDGAFGFHPAKVRGGDEFLGVCGQVMQEGVASGWVKFAKYVVQQVDGGLGATLLEKVALGELEGEGDGSLLPFAGVVRGEHAVQADGEIIAVRADDGLSGRGLALAGLEDRFFHRRAGGGKIGKGEFFVFP